MPSVEELLSQTSEEVETYADTGIEYCTVDDDTRVVTVPEKYRKLGVESDEKAKRIWFRFPKLVGNNGVDLSAIGVRVNFRNANGDGDIYIVEDLTTDGDYVTFSWELTRKVTAYKGHVSFVVCAVKSATDGTTKNEWNTTLNKECEVLEGLEVTEQITQENPDIIEYILANLGGSVSAEDIATAVEEYMAKNPPSGMTAEEKEQLDKNTEDISSLSEEIVYLKNNGTGGGSGWTSSQITLLETIGEYLLFKDESTGQAMFNNLIASLRNSSSGSDEPDTPINPDVPDTPTSYTITNSLVNVTTDNEVTSVEANGSYTANLTAESGYYIDSVTVTMGGVNVTNTVYVNGVITIAEVTGNVVIIANGAENDNLLTATVLSQTGVGSFEDGTVADGIVKSITPIFAVEPNTTYKFNLHEYVTDGHALYELKLAEYDSNQNYLGVKTYAMYNATSYTTTSNCHFINIMFFTGHPNPYFGKSGKVVDVPVVPEEPDNPEVTLTSISATYIGGEVEVGTSVNDLTGITVIAHYSDGSTTNITDYTLSGTIAEGSNTITVSYGGKTTTFTVTGVQGTVLLYELPQPTTFDGSTILDTECKPFINGTSDITIVGTFTNTQTTTEKAFMYSLLNGNDNALLGVWTDWQKKWMFMTYGYAGNTHYMSFDGVNNKFVVTQTKGQRGSIAHYILNGEYLTNSVSANGEQEQTENPIILGGQRKKDGTVDQYFTGTISDFKVYNRILSETEIKAYLGVN